jgi:hypothetical protein
MTSHAQDTSMILFFVQSLRSGSGLCLRHRAPTPTTCGHRAAASAAARLGKGGPVLRDFDPRPCTGTRCVVSVLNPLRRGRESRNPRHRNCPVAADDRRIIYAGLTPASKPSPRRNAPRGRMMMTPSLRRAGSYRPRRFRSGGNACAVRPRKPCRLTGVVQTRRHNGSGRDRVTVPGMAAEQPLPPAPIWQPLLVGARGGSAAARAPEVRLTLAHTQPALRAPPGPPRECMFPNPDRRGPPSAGSNQGQAGIVVPEF